MISNRKELCYQEIKILGARLHFHGSFQTSTPWKSSFSVFVFTFVSFRGQQSLVSQFKTPKIFQISIFLFFLSQISNLFLLFTALVLFLHFFSRVNLDFSYSRVISLSSAPALILFSSSFSSATALSPYNKASFYFLSFHKITILSHSLTLFYMLFHLSNLFPLSTICDFILFHFNVTIVHFLVFY